MQKVFRLVSVGLGLYVAWALGASLGLIVLGPFYRPVLGPSPWPGWIVGFFLTYFVVSKLVALVPAMLGAGRSKNSTTTIYRRRMIGYFGRGLVALIPLIGLAVVTKIIVGYLSGLVPGLFDPPAPHGSGSMTAGDVFGVVRLLIFLTLWIGAAVWLVHRFSRPLKILIGQKSKGLRRNLRFALGGYGGSAAFAGLLEEWAHPYERGCILLGYSLYDPGWRVGIRDNRHVLTMAGTGAGKGRTCVIPNLMEWPHSALVIDPKGTNAAVTAARRGAGGGNVPKSQAMGQKVYCINPFDVNADQEGMPRPSRFNPLSVISDPPSFREIDMIAEAIIMQAGGDNSWVTQGSQSIIAGLIDLVLKIKDPGQASLGDVRDLLTKTLAKSSPRNRSDVVDPNAVSIEGVEKLIKAMDAAGGIAQSAAAQLRAADDKERGIYFSDAINQTKWLNETAVRDSLSGNDFDFTALHKERCTVYLILPPSETQRQARFLRLFINLAVLTCLSKNLGVRGPDGMFLPREKPVPVLYFLDEFFNLGPMQTLSSAAALIRSYGVKIWPILQNLGQLNEMYQRNWQTFKANSSVSIYFGINDLETLNYISDRMGARVLWEQDRLTGQIVAGRIVNLRTGEEFARETGRESGRCFVHREGADPFILERINYDEYYTREQYNPDPDEDAETEEKTIFARAWDWGVASVRRETGPL